MDPKPSSYGTCAELGGQITDVSSHNSKICTSPTFSSKHLPNFKSIFVSTAHMLRSLHDFVVDSQEIWPFQGFETLDATHHWSDGGMVISTWRLRQETMNHLLRYYIDVFEDSIWIPCLYYSVSDRRTLMAYDGTCVQMKSKRSNKKHHYQ